MNRVTAMLVTALALGTAWAVRGQFGHEQGAAWAGAIGAMALILVSGRHDWYRKILTVSLASAVGWGAGGMISYGMVVGYGRSNDFPNVLYGLAMLFVIGGLFGLLGGGMTGLALESEKDKRVKWGCLLAEMTAGGIIAYFLLIGQLEILMTPPRSEAWAVCLGAGAAMLWHMARNGFRSSLKVSFITALGAGFGFASGNFLQVTGNVLGINFNMWNVMEYSIGFWGGLALSYAVFTSGWPVHSAESEPWENILSAIFIFVFIPLVVFSQSFGIEKLAERLGNAPENAVIVSNLVIGLILLGSAAFAIVSVASNRTGLSRSNGLKFFLLLFGTYIIASYIVTGAFSGVFMLNHHLYVLNFIVILLLIRYRKANVVFKDDVIRRWALMLLLIITAIIIMALILVNIHGELPGAQKRF